MSDENPSVILPASDKTEKITVRTEQFHIGPIPSAQQLEEYERVLPGSAERIMQRSEKEQEARHQNVTTLLSTMRLGTWLSFILPVLGLLGTIILALNGIVWPSVIPFSASIIPSILSFLGHKKNELPLELPN